MRAMRVAVLVGVASSVLACAGQAELTLDDLVDAAGDRPIPRGDHGEPRTDGEPCDGAVVDSGAFVDSGALVDLAMGSECAPRCGDTCPGQSDGCGGTCPDNTCKGCCDAANIC